MVSSLMMLCVFSSTRVGAERMLQCFADVATDFGLSVSTTKTKFQVVGHDVTGADRAPLLLNGTEIPCVRVPLPGIRHDS